MKKIVMTLVLLAMVSWTVYEYVFPLNDQEATAIDEANDESDPDLLGTSEESDASEQSPSAEDNQVGLNIGNLAPDFELTTLTGDKVALSDYRGKPIMLNFWATWCPPCRDEMPDMEKFYQNTEIEVLAVNLTETESNQDQIKQFIDDYELTFPILLDETTQVAMNYAIQPIPTSFFIDSSGIIQFKTFGPLTYEQMVEELAVIN